MAIVQCRYAEEQDLPMSEDDRGAGTYSLDWLVVSDEVDPSPLAILDGGRALSVSAGVDPIASRGDTYAFNGDADISSFAQTAQVKRIARFQDKSQWSVTINYAPLPAGKSAAYLTSSPLDWPKELWIDWVEEQVPIVSARCLTDLEGAQRGPSYPVGDGGGNEPGPIVNAAGEQTIEPLMQTIYRPILNILKNYASLDAIVGLNNTYESTVNSDSIYGAVAGQLRYVITASEKKQTSRFGGFVVTYFPGVTRLDFRKDGWARYILNNGMNKMVKTGGTYETSGSDRLLFPIKVKDEDSGEQVRTSEPLNLQPDGTYVPNTIANNIAYQVFTSVAYATAFG